MNYRSVDCKNQIIKLTGDMKDNIGQIVLQLNCTCGAKTQLYKILSIYAEKIKKLRSQRNDLKSKCQQLKEEVQKIKKDIPVESIQKKENLLIENDQNIFEILYDQTDRKQPQEDNYQWFEEQNDQEQTLLLSEVKNIENQQKFEISQHNFKRKRQMKSLDNFLKQKTLTKERIQQDIECLKGIRKPLRDKSNFKH